MTTPNIPRAVDVFYDRGTGIYNVIIEKVDVATIPPGFFPGQKLNSTTAAAYGREVLAPLFAAAYENIDVKELHKKVLEPIDKLNRLLISRSDKSPTELQNEFREAHNEFKAILNEINNGIYAQLPRPVSPDNATQPIARA